MGSMTLETADAIRVISYLNKLAEKTQEGFVKFSEIASSSEIRGVVYNDLGDNEVVLDMVVDEMHHDIVSTYESVIGAPTSVIEDESGLYVDINLPHGSVVIEDGRWYFCA